MSNTDNKKPETLSPAEMVAKSAAQIKDETSKLTTLNASTPVAGSIKPSVELKKPQLVSNSQKVRQFDTLADRFIQIRRSTDLVVVVNNRETTRAERSIKAFGRLINYIWVNQNDLDVLNACRKFFMTHRHQHLSCEEALQGMNYITSEGERDRYGIMFMLMWELTNPARNRTTYDLIHATTICENQNCQVPNGFIEYIASRMR